MEARPPRQMDDTIPKELERICLKALSKRASERYTTAKDMADDLRHFLAEQRRQTRSRRLRSAGECEPCRRRRRFPARRRRRPRTAGPSRSCRKGLRSFDAHDADFFLELLPGPRDRDGLPDSIRFWKTRIEETDADNTFSVGLIYGPSGCGKSSLVKAGLLPRLSEQRDRRLRRGHGRGNGNPAAERPAQTLSGPARQPGPEGDAGGTAPWAGRSRGQEGADRPRPVRAMAARQEGRSKTPNWCKPCGSATAAGCSASSWCGMISGWRSTRFMRELEIRLRRRPELVRRSISSTWTTPEKVLAAFGRAFGKLPENAGETSKDQKQFLEQAVSGLAQEGKVICVRLALFAEMMKGKAWTPATLKEVGGTEGVGVTFLEETFSAATAPPEHRYHQKAARAVLKALLPESGTDIKGHMRSHAELLEASGYGSRPKDFDDLIRILDSEIRLITPTDPEGKEEAMIHVPGPGRCRNTTN